MNTTGRSLAGMVALSLNRSSRAEGMRSPRIPTSLLIAAVEPLPAKITTVSSVPWTAAWMMARASSRRRDVCSPVPLESECVFA